MSSPIKVDLYLKEQSECNLYSTNVGGDPSKIIKSMNNTKYKYLEGEYLEDNYLDQVEKISEKMTKKICFVFDDEINIYGDIEGSKYLGKGGITSVFGLKYLTNNFMKELTDKKLILRAIDFDNFINMNEFIKKYNKNKMLFDSNMIDIYMYGYIYLGDKLLCTYTITRKYYDYNYIKNLEYNEMISYFKSLLEFLVKLEANEYFYRDLKFANIGLDLIDNANKTNNITHKYDYKFVVLDYDEATLINKNDSFFTNYNMNGCYEKYCAGTLIPYFIIKDYFELNPNWIKKFDKVYIVGLVDIIINLFFTKEKNSSNVLKILYKPCHYNTCIHYYRYLKIFDDKTSMDLLEYSLINLKPKFIELEHNKKDCLIYLIMNLLNKDYSLINSPTIILNEYTNQIINTKSKILVPGGKYKNIDEIEFVPITKSSSPEFNELELNKSTKQTKSTKLNNSNIYDKLNIV